MEKRVQINISNKHNLRNIHDVHNQNRTLDEITEFLAEERRNSGRAESVTTDMLMCYLCLYETTEVSQMDDHGFHKHGILNCDKCDYTAEDSDIMTKHKINNTGRILFSCGICEFEASKQCMLENHKESKHANKEHSKEEVSSHECRICDTVFQYSFLLKSHACVPAFKFPCGKCSFVGITLGEVLEHMEEVHIMTLILCAQCDFTAQNKNSLEVHMAKKHKASEKVILEESNSESLSACSESGNNFPDIRTLDSQSHPANPSFVNCVV